MKSKFQQYVEKIDGHLKERIKEAPLKGQKFGLLMKEIENLCEYLTNSIKSYIPEKEILNLIENFKRKPIFICGNPKSGTSLILELLDGHNNIFALPGDSGYFYAFLNKKWDSYKIKEHWLKRLISPRGVNPSWFLGKEEKTYKKFLSYFDFFSKNYTSDLFMAVIFSIYAANPKRSERVKHWVEKTPGNEFHMDLLIKKYPEAKFIHIIRNPLENMASLKKFNRIRKVNFVSWEIALNFKKSYKIALENHKNKNYFILRYEDLISNVKKTMIKVCDFIGIDFEDILLIPTLNKELSTSNTMYKDSLVVGSVKNKSNDMKWKKGLKINEKKDIVSILYDLALKLGYNKWKLDYIQKYNSLIRVVYIKYLIKPLSIFKKNVAKIIHKH